MTKSEPKQNFWNPSYQATSSWVKISWSGNKSHHASILGQSPNTEKEKKKHFTGLAQVKRAESGPEAFTSLSVVEAGTQNGVKFGSISLSMWSSYDGAPLKTLLKVATTIKHLRCIYQKPKVFSGKLRWGFMYTFAAIYTCIPMGTVYQNNSPPYVCLT